MATDSPSNRPKRRTARSSADASPEQQRRGATELRMAQGVPQNFHALYDRGFRAARGIQPTPPPQETRGHRSLLQAVPDLVVEYDPTTQLPNRVVTQQPTTRLSLRRGGSPEEAVRDFVENRGDLWNLTPEDVATVEVVSVSRKGLSTVNLLQRVEGKEVFNSDVTAAVSPANEVISLAGQLFPGAAASNTRTRARAAVATSEEEAIAKAATDLTGVTYDAADFSPIEAPPDSGPYRFFQHTPKKGDTRPPFERPVRLKDVMFPLGEGQFVPGYYIELWIRTFPAFSYVMDAVDTPDLLYRKNMTFDATFKYRVHNTGDAIFRPEDGPAPGSPHPTGIPDGFQAPTI